MASIHHSYMLRGCRSSCTRTTARILSSAYARLFTAQRQRAAATTLAVAVETTTRCCRLKHAASFVQHPSAWVPVDMLDSWDIRYTPVEQRAGELIVTTPGA